MGEGAEQLGGGPDTKTRPSDGRRTVVRLDSGRGREERIWKGKDGVGKWRESGLTKKNQIQMREGEIIVSPMRSVEEGGVVGGEAGCDWEEKRPCNRKHSASRLPTVRPHGQIALDEHYRPCQDCRLWAPSSSPMSLAAQHFLPGKSP